MFPEDLIESAAAPSDRPPEPFRFEPHFETEYEDEAPAPRRLWLHVLLLIATLISTTLVGAHMMYNFQHNLPFFDIQRIPQILTVGLSSPSAFFSGLPFSLTLLTILMAHEMGHYLACLWYGVDASLPYFLPSPVPVTGTFGAFIRIRSRIPSKKILFDIGVAGPLAGFVFLVPALGIGLALSHVLPGINTRGALQLGVPPLQWVAEQLIFPGVPTTSIYLHPIARAAWVGMFATAMNLLPAGQLDGGHIVYALAGRLHKWITGAFLIALIPLGRYWEGWWFWAVILFLFARKHPPVYDQTELGGGRTRIGFAALAVFLLCFSVAPIID